MSIRANLFDQEATGIGGRIDLRYLAGLDLIDQSSDSRAVVHCDARLNMKPIEIALNHYHAGIYTQILANSGE